MRMEAQSLANSLSCSFNFEMNTPHIAVFNLSLREEAVITTVKMVSMIGRTTVQHVTVVIIIRQECLSKLLETNTVVLVQVVSLEEQTHLISGREDSNSC